jgi:lysyl-tRNA synthetase class 1
MSSSVGNLVTVDQALKIIPPEILRFFVLKSRPQKQLNFDPGIGMYNLIDEFSKVAIDFNSQVNSEFLESYQFSVLDKNHQTVSKIPFSHLVSSFQTAFGDASDQKGVILRQLRNVKYWLEHFAPDNVKFSLQKKLPEINLSQKQKSFCQMLAKLISNEKNLSAQGLHDAIYTYSDQLEVKSAEAFATIYQLFLSQDSGPKAGFFLASLDKNFVISRLELKA